MAIFRVIASRFGIFGGGRLPELGPVRGLTGTFDLRFRAVFGGT